MIHPFLRERTLTDRVTDIAKAGAEVLLKRLQKLLEGQPDFKFVQFTPVGCAGDSVDGPTVQLCGSTASQLKLVLDAAGVKLPGANLDVRFLGRVGDVRDAISKAQRRVGFSIITVLPYAFLAGALWLLRPSGGLLSEITGYPAEMARGAVYAGDCEEAQRRLDMAWKGLQQMENRGDPQFVHEANKVAKIAKQLRNAGCEVL